VRALVPTTLLTLSRQHFQTLFARSRELRKALLRLADERLEAEAASEALYEFLFGSASAAGTNALQRVSTLPLLQHVPAGLRLETINLFTPMECTAGTVVVEEGAPGDSFYLVISGALSAARGSREIARLEAGEAFGEMALLEDAPRTATVTTVAATRLLRLSRAAFTEFLQRAPAVERHLRELAAARHRANADTPNS
jgi:CRP-like cAMP-binding protein